MAQTSLRLGRRATRGLASDFSIEANKGVRLLFDGLDVGQVGEKVEAPVTSSLLP